MFEMALQELEQSGVVDKVRVLATACCESCRQNDGIVMTFEEARRRRLLPCPTCTTKLYDDLPHSWCRCDYVAELE